jgi:hypothetical protein
MGQLALLGPGIFAGYLSQRSREEVLRDGWFLTAT